MNPSTPRCPNTSDDEMFSPVYKVRMTVLRLSLEVR